jgi:hypothetical protein
VNTAEQEPWQRGHDLADLRWHWDMTYVITWESGQFCAERNDTGAAVRKSTAAELYAEIRTDYSAMPVARQPKTHSPGGAP